MTKSKIIMELADCSISAEKALKRLYVIASDLEDYQLLAWIEKELNGYSFDEDVPEYRDLGTGVLKFSGFAGTRANYIQYKNSPLPIQAVPEKHMDALMHFYCRDTIATIEQWAQNSESLSNDLSHMIPEIKAGVLITSLYREYHTSSFWEVKNKLLSMLLKIFVKLDKTFGNLDDLDVGNASGDEIKEASKYIHQVVFVDNSITIGDNNKLRKSKILSEG